MLLAPVVSLSASFFSINLRRGIHLLRPGNNKYINIGNNLRSTTKIIMQSSSSNIPSYYHQEHPIVASEEGNADTYHRIIRKLHEQHISYEHLGPHEPTLTSQQSAAARQSLGWEKATLASGAKAMLLKYYGNEFVLTVMAANEKLDWKKMKKLLGGGSKAKKTRMATVEEVWNVTRCLPGAVPPFGSLFSNCISDDDLDDQKPHADSDDGDGSTNTSQKKGGVEDESSSTNQMRLRTFCDRSLQRQGEVIQFNCGLRTRSIQMTVTDYLTIEAPELCDFIVVEK